MWNSLQPDAVNSKTVVEFKTKLDKIWLDMRYDMADIYLLLYKLITINSVHKLLLVQLYPWGYVNMDIYIQIIS